MVFRHIGHTGLDLYGVQTATTLSGRGLGGRNLDGVRKLRSAAFVQSWQTGKGSAADYATPRQPNNPLIVGHILVWAYNNR